jgi:hypothetical protein
MIKIFCKTICSFRLNGKNYRKRFRLKIETNPFKRVTVGALLPSIHISSFIIIFSVLFALSRDPILPMDGTQFLTLNSAGINDPKGPEKCNI